MEERELNKKERELNKKEIAELNSSVKKGSRFAITTVDNPFDPFTQFNEWFLFDIQKGYNTCSYLDRIAKTSLAFTDQENEEEIERAIDEIIKYDFLNIYKKVKNSYLE